MPGNRRSWPYALPETVAALPATLPGGKAWPRISVITPSFNQGRYIEQTILSVLNQGYPNLEYILIDGGSSDETMEVVNRYADRLAHVESEKDRGQSHAINKGLARSTGELVTWINSDDMLEPQVLARMAMAFYTSGADVVAGICQLHSGGKITDRHLTGCAQGVLPLEELADDERWLSGQFFYQPEVMFTRDLWDRSGGKLDEKLFYTMDCDLWMRFARAGARLHVIGQPICLFRVHDQQKTAVASNFKPELAELSKRYGGAGLKKGRRPGASGLPRMNLRMVFFNDCGDQTSAGIHLHRLASAAALAGHDVVSLGAMGRPGKCGLSSEQILEAIGGHHPDLVVLGELGGAQVEVELSARIAQRWATVGIGEGECVGVATNQFRPRDRSACRDLLHLPQDRFIVLFVAREIGEERKGFSHLVGAMRAAKLADAMIVCVGKSENGARTNAGGAEDLEIRNVGFVADPKRLAMYYAAADLVVLPDLARTDSPVSLEAAACGTPCVSYANGGNGRVIDGIGGRIVATAEAGALARAIGELFENPRLREEMGAWGRIWVENEYSLARAYQEFFVKLRGMEFFEGLNLPPRVFIRYEEFLPSAVTYLEKCDAPESAATMDDPNGVYAVWDAERQSLRRQMDDFRRTRLWRMVNFAYPKYQRAMNSAWMPGFARRGIFSVGQWLGGKTPGNGRK